jgi:hypothetical protein
VPFGNRRPIIRHPNQPHITPGSKVLVRSGYIINLPKEYDVAYPYGVGGTSILDQLAAGGRFDDWILNSTIAYFFGRFVLQPFGIPSLTDLLFQAAQAALAAISGRSLNGFFSALEEVANRVFQRYLSTSAIR